MEIPDPPEQHACTDCMRALLWLYSGRKARWVAFVTGEANTLAVHRCTTGDPNSWRSRRSRWEPATPEQAERVHRGAEMVRQALAGNTPEPLDERT